MKHYEICLDTVFHRMKCECSTICEVFRIIDDFDSTFRFGFSCEDLNEIMIALVKMETGNKISYSHRMFTIYHRDGEV